MSLVIDQLVLRLPASGLGSGGPLSPEEARELGEAVALRLAAGDAAGRGVSPSAGPRQVAALGLSLRIEGRGPAVLGRGASRIEPLADAIAEQLGDRLSAY